MHPKNSTTPSKAQAPLLTESVVFHQNDGEDPALFSVNGGLPAAEALHIASCLLGASEGIITKLLDTGMDTNDSFGVRFLIEASRTLINATVNSVEFGNRQGGEA